MGPEAAARGARWGRRPPHLHGGAADGGPRGPPACLGPEQQGGTWHVTTLEERQASERTEPPKPPPAASPSGPGCPGRLAGEGRAASALLRRVRGSRHGAPGSPRAAGSASVPCQVNAPPAVHPRAHLSPDVGSFVPSAIGSAVNTGRRCLSPPLPSAFWGTGPQRRYISQDSVFYSFEGPPCRGSCSRPPCTGVPVSPRPFLSF